MTADTSPTLDPRAAREQLLAAHADLVEMTLDCAAAVASDFPAREGDDPATRDSQAARYGLRATLERAGVCRGLATALPDLVDAAGGVLSATPVPAPPYVAVPADGPVVRATVDGERLVIRIAVFAVADGAFVWRDRTPEAAVQVAVRE